MKLNSKVNFFLSVRKDRFSPLADVKLTPEQLWQNSEKNALTVADA